MSQQPVTGQMFLTVRIVDSSRGWSLAPVKVTAQEPRVVEADMVVVRVRVAIPFAAFRPLIADPLILTEDAVATRAEVTA